MTPGALTCAALSAGGRPPWASVREERDPCIGRLAVTGGRREPGSGPNDVREIASVREACPGPQTGEVVGQGIPVRTDAREDTREGERLGRGELELLSGHRSGHGPSFVRWWAAVVVVLLRGPDGIRVHL